MVAALTWGHLLEGQGIRFHCDDLPIVQAWTNQSSMYPTVMELLRTLFFIAAQQFHSLPGTPPRPTELYCGCTITKPDLMFLLPGQPAANTSVSQAGRALEGHLSHLLHRAVAPSTSTTYRAVLHLLSYTRHQPFARNQAFHQPVCRLSKPNTPGQHHSGVPGSHQSPTPYPWVQQSSA